MNKFKTVLAFSLVIFAVGFCVHPIFGQAPQRARRPLMQIQARERLPVPDLTDEQQEQLKKLRENQREVQEQFMDTIKDLNQKLYELRQDPAANAIEIEKIQDTLFNLKIEQMKKAYQHRKEIKKIFTPEQLEKMSALPMRSPLRGRAALNRRFPRGNRALGRGLSRGQRPMAGRNRFFQRGYLWRRR